MSKVSVIGLGKLGAPFAACYAAKGHEVVGVDLNEHLVALVNAGKAPVIEPRLQEMMDQSRGRLQAIQDAAEAVRKTDITFVIVPTPSNPAGGFSTAYVEEAGAAIGKALAAKNSYHLVVLDSTVLPGGTQKLRDALLHHSGKKIGEGIGLCYSPQFVAIGSVIDGFLRPDFSLIGESDPKAGETLEQFYKTVFENNPPIARTSIVNAEITKLAVNTYVTTKISFANMLAGLCERVPGSDVDAVTSILGMDSRIGSKYLKGGLGYGGPCFPRDNIALASFARQMGFITHLPEGTHTHNESQIDRLTKLVKQHAPSGVPVAVIGLAYKPGTPVIDESQGVMLASRLADAGYQVVVHDPLAEANARAVLGNRVRYASLLQDAGAAVAVFTFPEKALIKEYVLHHAGSRALTVIDCWRVFRHDAKTFANVRYVGVGLGSHEV